MLFGSRDELRLAFLVGPGWVFLAMFGDTGGCGFGDGLKWIDRSPRVCDV